MHLFDLMKFHYISDMKFFPNTFAHFSKNSIFSGRDTCIKTLAIDKNLKTYRDIEPDAGTNISY